MSSNPTERHKGERGASAPCCAGFSEGGLCQNASAGLRLPLAWAIARVGRLKNLHGDERGTISIMAVFSMLMFTMLLVMVTNVARHADDKIRMQNAADAAAQTGAVTIARGMNSIAFTNHLLCEVFALTAYMREAGQPRGEGSESLTDEILEEWRKTGLAFQQAAEPVGHQKFAQLGKAIQEKVEQKYEKNVVNGFVEMSAEHSRLTLPVFEYILGGPNWSGTSTQSGMTSNADPLGGFIPRFQRAVVANTPKIAHLAASEIVQRHGDSVERQHNDRSLQSRLWRADVQMLGQGRVDEFDPWTRTFPAVDPSPSGPDSGISVSPVPYTDREGGTYFEIAVNQRRRLALYYLEQWILEWMGDYFDFDLKRETNGMNTAKMSNLINLWRSATCDHLDHLLNDEYPDTNLPHVIRSRPEGTLANQTVEADYSYVGVVYWPHLTEMAPGVFSNPLKFSGRQQSGALAFSQATVYIPRRRYVRRNGSWVYWAYSTQPPPPQWRPVPYVENWPLNWGLFNQNWMARLTPADSDSIVDILQQSPGGSIGLQPPRLDGVIMDDVRAINTH